MIENGSVHKVLVHTNRQDGRSVVLDALGDEFVDLIDEVGFENFVEEIIEVYESGSRPEAPGLWWADFRYDQDEDESWDAVQVSEWARLTPAQASAVAEGKPLAEVVTL